ncbi:MAG: hypothetical protein AAF682_16435 [Planctomycetota bacterium]
MKPSPSRLFQLVLPALLAGPLLGQGHELVPLASAPDRGLAGLHHVDGELWAGGDAYKARLDERGVDVTAMLGREAERSLPLRLELAGFRRGDGALIDAGPGAAPELAGDLRAERERLEVRERYDVGSEGIELSYVFDRIPAGAGDLAVRLDVATDLGLPAPGEYAGGLRFVAPNGGGLEIGAVLGIDAAGQQAAGSLIFDGAALELRLPGDFVATAEAPLIVDPVISSIFDLTAGVDHRDPALSYDETTGYYLCAWRRWYALDDGDIWAQRLDEDGAPVGFTLFLEPSIPDSSDLPAIGNAADTDQFFVVWQEDATTQGLNIYGRSVRASDGFVSKRVTVAASFDDDERPDVSNSTFDNRVLVVWEQEFEGIKGRTVELPSSGTPVLYSTTTYYGSPNAHRPSISKSTDSIGFQLLTWEQFYSTPAPGDHDILGMVVSNIGSTLSGTLTIAGQIGPDETRARSDGDGHSWLVTYGVGETLTTLFDDLYCASVIEDAFGFRTDQTGILIDNQENTSEKFSRVASTGDEYVVAYLGRPSGFGDLRVVLKTFDGFCGHCGDISELDQSYVSLGGEFGLASQRSGSGSAVPSDEAMVIYSSWTSPGSGGQLQGAVWRTEAGEYIILSTGCGGPETIAPCANAGNENFAIRIEGADPFEQAWMLLGMDSYNQVCGAKCSLVVNPFTGYVVGPVATDDVGRAAIPLPLPDSASVVGLSFRAQWAITPMAGGGTCPELGVNLSEGLLLTIE